MVRGVVIASLLTLPSGAFFDTDQSSCSHSHAQEAVCLWLMTPLPSYAPVSAVSALIANVLLAVIFILSLSHPASAAPLSVIKVNALPAFARKYGMPCSSCHVAWPMLSPFGQAFKDNGYQMGNDRDAPIFQNPAYWPVTFRITPIWHRENQPTPPLTTRPRAKPASRRTVSIGAASTSTPAARWPRTSPSMFCRLRTTPAAFHFETVMARLDNLAGSYLAQRQARQIRTR